MKIFILMMLAYQASVPWASAQGAIGPGPSAHAFTITAIVQSAEAGDRLTLDLAGKPSIIQLKNIDTPPLDQVHGREAAARMRALVQGQEVTARIGGFAGPAALAEVVSSTKGEDLAALLVRDGLAWVRPDCVEEKYRAAEAAAKKEKLGIWRDSTATPTWVVPAEKSIEGKEYPRVSANDFLMPAVILAIFWLLFMAGKKWKKRPAEQDREPRAPRPEKPITKLLKAYIQKKIDSKPNTSKEDQ